MNIHDFDGPEQYPTDMLADIFERQTALAHKYHPIEKANGFNVGDDLLVNVHDKFGQHRIKDFSWRVTEELMEALEAWYVSDVDHCQEEVADALHFMVELCIICGIDPDKLDFEFYEQWEGTTLNYQEASAQVVYLLGMACNCLKNKPWKQTQMKTDEHRFEANIIEAFSALIIAAKSAGIESQRAMYDLYFKKNKVNSFRQESKY
jgi:hypothetical protein